MPRTIVLIDDEQDLILMLTQALELKGYEVHSASSGDKGLELVRRLNPDAVICDLMMPGTSGLEVCKQLRADPTTKDLPIVVISGIGSESNKPEEFWAAGLKSDDFISKPFEAPALLGRLEYVLRRSQYKSTKAAEEARQKEELKIKSPAGDAVEPIPLEEAAPKMVVRSFIESWNDQDFDTEFRCMDAGLTGGLSRNDYIARRRQVYVHDAGQDRKQIFSKVLEQRRSGDETILVCERKDMVRGKPQIWKEEYRLRKMPDGWKIFFVKRQAK